MLSPLLNSGDLFANGGDVMIAGAVTGVGIGTIVGDNTHLQLLLTTTRSDWGAIYA
jgi:hypothetical protein